MFPCCQGLDTRLIRLRGRAAGGGRSRDRAATDDLWDTEKAASSLRSLRSLTHADVVMHVLMYRYTHKTDSERETKRLPAYRPRTTGNDLMWLQRRW